jgi:hypothetical protein
VWAPPPEPTQQLSNPAAYAPPPGSPPMSPPPEMFAPQATEASPPPYHRVHPPPLPNQSAAPEQGPPPGPPPADDPPAHGTAAVASVPTANRVTPSQAELPSFTPQPRVYQATAGAPQPVADPAPPRHAPHEASHHQAPPPAAEAQLPTRTPGETPLPPPTAGEPLPTRTPAETLPPHAQPPRPRQASAPVYSDLLAPSSAAGAQPAPPPPSMGPGLAPPPNQPPPNQPPYGQPPPGAAPAPAPPGGPGMPYDAGGQPAWAASPPPPDGAPGSPPGGPYIPQQRMGAAPPDRFDQLPPPGGDEEAGAAGKSGPSTGLIVGMVLVGATVLVVGALGVTFLLGQLRGSAESTYQVGECVVQSGDAAEPAACSDPGAYEIVAQVDSQAECGDPTQPAIEVSGPPVQFYCLSPAAEGGGGDPDETAEPSADPEQDGE